MSRVLRHALAAVAVCVVAGGWLVSPAAAADTLFSGRATVIDGTVAGIPITLVDTGNVSPQGGDLEANLFCYPTGTNCTIGDLPDLTNGMVGARVLHAAVVAQGNQSSAEASVAELNLVGVAGNNISAEFLMADATATCTGETASISGGAEVAELTINGKTIAVTGEVNQRVDLLAGGYVIINEQVATVDGRKGDLTVSALHIVIPGVGPVAGTDLYVARAHADVMCAPAARDCRGSRVTGGGWYEGTPVVPAAADSRRVHFALAARDGINTWGHLNYMDKALDLKVKGTPMSATIVPNGKNDGAGTVTGTASANRTFDGRSVGLFKVVFLDAGEPGRGDQFAIVLLTAAGDELYRINVDASGSLLGQGLRGGNLQVHACK